MQANDLSTTRVWLDTDMGSDVDDALALGYAIRHPEIELVGVSTVFGDVDLRARIAEALLDRADANGIPVVVGLGKPLDPDRDGLMFGHEGQALLLDPEPRMRTRADPDRDGVIQALGEAIAGARPDVVVAIGPLTNIGALIQAGVELPRLAIMGGKTREMAASPRRTGIDEWNWYCDATAVREMLGRAYPEALRPRVVPAEVTYRTRFLDEDLAALEGGDALARALAALSQRWLEFLRGVKVPEPAVLLHDPLTLATVTHPGLCPTEPACLAMSDDARTRRVEGPANVDLAIDVDEEETRRLIRDTLLGVAR